VPQRLRSGRLEFEDYPAAVAAYFDRGWTDGLPVVPPTPELVEAMLESSSVTADEELGSVPTRGVVVLAEDAATNAVMAGCLPEYFPVVLAAVRALLRDEAAPHSVTASLAGACQVVLINGPIRARVWVACGQGCMGPGFRANATIGRALRLVVRNVLGSRPGELDRGVFSSPGSYSFCFGEDEEGAPFGWPPLHVERGYAAEVSTATVASAMAMFGSRGGGNEPSRVIEGYAESLFFDGTLWESQLGEPADIVVVTNEGHQRLFAGEGWTKDHIREALWAELCSRRRSDGATVRLGRPEGILLVAAGGPGSPGTVFLTPHVALAVTEPIHE
jgi:hypothetical protein